MELLLATTNLGKLTEYQTLLTGLPITWRTLSDIGLDHMDVEETGATFAENALLKARTYCAESGMITLSDDSGLAVDHLGGAPGIYSARYAPTTPERIAKLLNALDGVPDVQRDAQFICVAALVTPDRITIMTEGIASGKIGHAPIGDNGFGYDPVFIFPDGRTMAQLSSAEKDQIGHRGLAVAKLRPLIIALATVTGLAAFHPDNSTSNSTS